MADAPPPPSSVKFRQVPRATVSERRSLLLFHSVATLDRQDGRHSRPRSADAQYGALAARGDLQLDAARLALRERGHQHAISEVISLQSA